MALALAVVCARAAAAQDSAKEEIETCLSCHSDDSLSVTFENGQSHALAVDRNAFAHSVHGDNLKCTDCHAGMGEIPHPERKYADLPHFRASFRDTCKSCHFDNYTQSLDGVHYTLLATRRHPGAGLRRLPRLARRSPPRASRARRSRAPARAVTQAISAVYAKSVHGKRCSTATTTCRCAPTATASHDIADPRTTAWLVKTPELCGKCHTNETLMAKYGLSPNVVSTYLADFHGMSASLTNTSGTAARKERLTAALHRLPRRARHHARRRPDSPCSRRTSSKTCRKCHQGAPESFPAAWLSHYEPAWQKAPIVYAVKVFYRIFIPFMIGGLVLQILLHLWRLVVNR